MNGVVLQHSDLSVNQSECSFFHGPLQRHDIVYMRTEGGISRN